MQRRSCVRVCVSCFVEERRGEERRGLFVVAVEVEVFDLGRATGGGWLAGRDSEVCCCGVEGGVVEVVVCGRGEVVWCGVVVWPGEGWCCEGRRAEEAGGDRVHAVEFGGGDCRRSIEDAGVRGGVECLGGREGGAGVSGGKNRAAGRPAVV